MKRCHDSYANTSLYRESQLNSVQGNSILFTLPLDVIPNILSNVSATDFPELALVCKDWKIIVDREDFEKSSLSLQIQMVPKDG